MILFIVLIILLVLLLYITLIHRNRRTTRLQNEFRKQQEEVLKNYRTSLDEAELLQHDVQNHLNTIQGLADRGESEEALAYLRQFRVRLQEELKK